MAGLYCYLETFQLPLIRGTIEKVFVNQRATQASTSLLRRYLSLGCLRCLELNTSASDSSEHILIAKISTAWVFKVLGNKLLVLETVLRPNLFAQVSQVERTVWRIWHQGLFVLLWRITIVNRELWFSVLVALLAQVVPARLQGIFN